MSQVRRADKNLGKTPNGGTGGSFAVLEREPAGEPRRKSYDEFREALTSLDAELQSLNLPEPVRVNAVGGFALLFHELRDDGYTVDIDTVTPDYPPEVRQAINRVAEDLELEQDWINNEVAGSDPEHVANMLDAVYLRQDFGLKNVELHIASIPTLTRAKAYAVSDSHLSNRSRDWDDLLSLLEVQGIDSIGAFEAQFPEVEAWEYPDVHFAIDHFFRTGDRAMAVSPDMSLDLDDLDFIDFGELDYPEDW